MGRADHRRQLGNARFTNRKARDKLKDKKDKKDAGRKDDDRADKKKKARA